MNISSAAMPSAQDEFMLAGLDAAPSTLVRAPRVAASPVSFECRVTQCIQLRSAQGTAVETWLVLGEVVMVHILKSLLVDGRYMTAAAAPILRGGGGGDYFEISPAALFRMRRPD